MTLSLASSIRGFLVSEIGVGGLSRAFRLTSSRFGSPPNAFLDPAQPQMGGMDALVGGSGLVLGGHATVAAERQRAF